GVVAAALAASHAAARSLDHRPVFDAAGDEEHGAGSHASIGAALRAAFREPSLLAWSIAGTATNLLDEVLVAFSAVHLAAMGATPGERSAALAAWVCGDLAGLAALERAAGKVPARRLLA